MSTITIVTVMKRGIRLGDEIACVPSRIRMGEEHALPARNCRQAQAHSATCKAAGKFQTKGIDVAGSHRANSRMDGRSPIGVVRTETIQKTIVAGACREVTGGPKPIERLDHPVSVNHSHPTTMWLYV